MVGIFTLFSSFDELLLFLPWSNLWVQHKGMVKATVIYEADQGVKCLLVRSRSARVLGDKAQFRFYGRSR